MSGPKVVFVCRNCRFTSFEEGAALKHASPLHVVVKFTQEIVA